MSSNQKAAWAQTLSQNQQTVGSPGDHGGLGNLKPETVIETLQQVSNSDSVTGMTVRIVELAGNSNDEIRMWAAEALERAIQPSADEISSLIKVLEENEEGEVRYWAATMLGRLGGAAAQAGQALSDCLDKSLHLPARERSAWALCQIGEAAAVAKDSLSKAAEDAPPRLKRLATEALKRIGEAA
ncbi:hypothetical protein LF1_50900 [Rubripirellula obstinata]|uniref:HEAT repeat protein n=1 Tax=Rubripirellula obstinata TaxID=406547 RepID=A0A5B1CRC9_9BACT|nr:HEAT repeat domain-containing protein [Rubripirellula obstinata]KAA1262525.1 hypothetical protein LF1_50900 [Rubripirellula obstinata]